MGHFEWSKEAGERLRKMRINVAGNRGRTAFGREANIPHTTLLEWEDGRVKPDLQRLCYLLSLWRLRLSFIVTGAGSPLIPHKLGDAIGYLAPVNYPLARFYLVLMLRSKGGVYGRWAKELEAVKEEDLAEGVVRISMLAVNELLDEPLNAAYDKTDWDMVQLSMTHSHSDLLVAEGMAEYKVKRRKRKEE